MRPERQERARRRPGPLALCGHGLHGLLRVALRLGLLLALLVGGLVFAARQGPIALPDFLVAKARAEIAQRLAPGLSAEIGGLSIGLGRGLAPAIAAKDVLLRGQDGAALLQAERLEAVFAREPDPETSPLGQIRIAGIAIDGIAFDFTRTAEGGFAVATGGAGGRFALAGPQAAAAQLRMLLDTPTFSSLTEVQLSDITLHVTDAITGRSLNAHTETLGFDRDGEVLRLSGNLTLPGAISAADPNSAVPGALALSIVQPAPEAEIAFAFGLREVVPSALARLPGAGPLADVAARLAAPVTLDLSGRLAGDEIFPAALAGEVEVGAGQVYLPGINEAQPIDRLAAELRLSLGGRRLEIRDIDLAGPAMALRGRLDLLSEGTGGARIAAQLAIDHLAVDPGALETSGAMPTPAGARPATHAAAMAQVLSLDGLWADFSYDRNAGHLTLAALTVHKDGAELTARGQIDPGTAERGPSYTADLAFSPISAEALLALWPETLLVPTRRWLARNLVSGQISGFEAAIHRAPGGDPSAALNFAFADAVLTPARGLPLISQASGIGSFADGQFALRLDRGITQALEGGEIALSNGRLLLDTRGPPPKLLSLTVQADAPAAAALSFSRIPALRGTNPALPRPPPAPTPVEPADLRGSASAEVALRVPIGVPGLGLPVGFEIRGIGRDIATRSLLKGRLVTADEVAVTARNGLLLIGGDAKLEGAPVTFQLRHELRRDPPPAQISAEGALDQRLLDAFAIKIPGVELAGAGRAQAEVALIRGAPPRVRLSADLAGLAIRQAALGLDKPAASRGRLELAGALGSAPQLDQLLLETPELAFDGRVRMRPGGGLEELALRRVRLGDWAELGLRHVRQPDGSLRLEVTGGTVDLSNRPDTGTPPLPQGTGASARTRIFVSLDRLTLAPGLSLTALNGEVSQRLEGRLRARLNGGPQLSITLRRNGRRTGIDLAARDAGAVLSALGAGVHLAGGDLAVRVDQRDRPGHWQGELTVRNARLHDAPGAAALLAALNVGSALEQAAGAGIALDAIRARFALAPDRIEIARASAEGPALGIAVDGRIDLARRRLDLSGSAAPLGTFNRAGLAPARRGEGGLTIGFTLRGPVDRPRVDIRR